MDLGLENPQLIAMCRSADALTLDHFIQRCQAFLADLMALDRAFTALHFVRAGDSNPAPVLASDLSNLRPWLLKHAWDAEWRQSYDERDARGDPTPASKGRFRLSLSNLSGFDGKVDVTVSVGPKIRGQWEGSCSIVLPRLNRTEFVEGALPLQMIETVVKHWPVCCAEYTTLGLLNEVTLSEPREARVGTLSIGWLTYAEDPDVAEGLPPEVPVQRLGFGIVFQLADRMPDATDPQQIAHAKHVREALRSAGRLHLASRQVLQA
jgi:hypothetical protein